VRAPIAALPHEAEKGSATVLELFNDEAKYFVNRIQDSQGLCPRTPEIFEALR